MRKKKRRGRASSSEKSRGKGAIRKKIITIGRFFRKIGALAGKPALAAFILFACGLALRLYFLNYPIRYDEAFTFLRFARLPFGKLIGYYPLPNNHILHTVLVKVSTLFFGPWEWAIRLPAFLAGLAAVAVMFFIGANAAGRNAGLWAMALAAAADGLVEYSVNGRGYSMVCLFTALLLITSLKVSSGSSSRWVWIVFILTSIAGLFTVLSMIYPLCILSVWLIAGADTHPRFDRSRIIRPLVLSWVLIISGTLLCYTPLMLQSGITSLLSNKFVQPQPLLEVLRGLPGLLLDVSRYYHRCLPPVMAIILTTGFIVGAWRFPRLTGAFILCSLGLILVQRVIPYVRVFTFGLIFYLFLTAIGLNRLSEWTFDRTTLRGSPLIRIFSPLIWALAAGVFVITGRGPVLSLDSYPEGKPVAEYLSARFDKNTDLFGIVPENETILYYLSKRGKNEIGFEWHNNLPPVNMLTVVNLRHDTLESLLRDYPHRFLYYNRPRRLTVIDSTEIYHHESVFSSGLKADAPLAEYPEELRKKDSLSTKDLEDAKLAVSIFYRLNEPNSAARVLAIILQHDPDSEYALNGMGSLLLERSRPAVAKLYFEKLLNVNPHNQEALLKLGILETYQGDPQKAEGYLSLSLKQDSTNFDALYNLGNLYVQTGHPDRAAPLLYKALAVKPQDGLTYLALGIMDLSKSDKKQEALKYFQQASRLLPDRTKEIEKNYIQPLLAEGVKTEPDSAAR